MITDLSPAQIPGVEHPSDLDTFRMAFDVANAFTKFTGKEHLPVDNGDHCYPRFEIVVAPVVGDLISYGIGGDRYLDGVITKITGSNFKKIHSSTGNCYLRRRLSASWKNGSCSLIVGEHVSYLDPSF